jgi:hypothetical protein
MLRRHPAAPLRREGGERPSRALQEGLFPPPACGVGIPRTAPVRELGDRAMQISAGRWCREVEEGKLQVQESKDGVSSAKQMRPEGAMGRGCSAAGTRESG